MKVKKLYEYHQLGISEICISLEIMLNVFNVWQHYFPLKALFLAIVPLSLSYISMPR